MYLMKLPHDRDKAFIELWTLKESYLKYEGTGLMTDISSFTVDKNKNCIEFDDNSKVHISFWTYVNTLDKKSRKIMLLFLVPHPPFAVVSNNQ